MSATPPSLPVDQLTKRFSDHGQQLAAIDIYPSSRLLRTQMLGLMILALTAPLALQDYLLEAPLWWSVLGLFWGLLALGAWSIQLARSQAPSRISYRAGDWYLTLGGVEYRAQLIGEVLLWQTLLVARFRLHNGAAKVSLVCLPDSLKREDFRRLKVWMRIYLWHRKS